jgi:hypothetical protein
MPGDPSADRVVTLYLTELLKWQLERGKHPFYGRVAEVFRDLGWTVETSLSGLDARLAAKARPGFALIHDDPPPNRRTLVARRTYFDPFWQVEAQEKRWEFAVARAAFDPEQVDPKRAAHFLKWWHGQLGLPVAKPPEGYVYVPLQGRLTVKRSFQAMSPLDMVSALAERETRPLAITLHPNETYTDADRSALERRLDALGLMLSDRPMEALLPACDYVATQNSSVALRGFFLRKPALLFGKIDFHHIAASVPRDGLDTAMARLADPPPDFARYLFWFFQRRALNHWRPEFPDRLRERLRAAGWPV